MGIYKGLPAKKNWVTDEISHETVTWAEDFAKFLVKKDFYKNDKGWKIDVTPLSTSQLRKFFGEIKRIQGSVFQEEISSILMLKPKLAYAVGRSDGENKIEDLFKQMSPLLDAIDVKNTKEGPKHFKNFVNIFEAIVAYHKANGGK